MLSATGSTGQVPTALLAVGFAIVGVVITSRYLSRWTGLPYPVFLLCAGGAAAFVPDVSRFTLNPQFVFLGFLPPLVYYAGFITSPRELKEHATPIGLGALGLVLMSTFAVAVVAWAALGKLGFIAAFILGAVIAPTDPVAATSVLNRLGGPPTMTAILEGESLVNDGVALSLFSLGLSAYVSPTSPIVGVITFIRIAGGGVAFGLIVGWLGSRARKPIRDPLSQLVLSLLVPYAAYLPADSLGLSGVLSALTAGLFLGRQGLGGLASAGRIRVTEFWEVFVFLLESILFVLLGFQLRDIAHGIGRFPAGALALTAGSVVATVITVRLAWWLTVPTFRWRPEGKLFDVGGVPWQERIFLGWSGLRGAISLAAALSIPKSVGGHRFVNRELLILVTFCVIAITLIGQGSTLPWMLRRLHLVGSNIERQQHALATRRLAEAALRELDQLVSEETIRDDDAEALRQLYERRIERVRDIIEEREQPHGAPEASLRSLQRKLISVQYEALRKIHQQGDISFSVMRAVRRELDLEQASLEG